MMCGRFEDCERFTTEAEATFRDRCQGTWWELTNARSFGIWSLIMLGRLRQLAERLPDLLRDCRERGDRLGLLSLTSGPIYMLRLAQHESHAMRDECLDGLSRWAQGGIHFQHLCGLFTLAAADLYDGHVEAALDHVEGKWTDVERSLLPRVQFFRLDLWALRGRVALAAAGRDPASPHLRRVRGAIRRIEREGTTWASGYAFALRAGLAVLRGRVQVAATLLQQGVDSFTSAAMSVHAAACEIQSRLVLGRDAGDALSRSYAALEQQGVRYPHRFAAALLPMPESE
jgi:hypothetical protein